MSEAALPRITVRPASGRLESLITALCCMVIGGACLAYAASKAGDDTPPPLLQWQVSAFDGLTPVDQAIHSALLPAAEQIASDYAFRGYWYPVKDLEELYIPPFQKDVVWEQNGRVVWTLHTSGADQASAFYMGTKGIMPGQGAYLLVMAHAHAGIAAANQNTVWIHKNNDPPVPSVVKAEGLVREGWRQVVAYSGADEARKVRGK